VGGHQGGDCGVWGEKPTGAALERSGVDVRVGKGQVLGADVWGTVDW